MNTFKPVTIRYIWDKENFERAFSHAYRHQFRHSARRYVGWLFVAMAQFGVVAALKGGSIGLLMLSTILIVYWYPVKKRMVYRRALSTFLHSPLRDKEIVLEVSQEGISQNDRFVPWEEIEGVVPIEEALLLYYKAHMFYIPEGAFASLEEKSRFKTIAKSKGRLFDV